MGWSFAVPEIPKASATVVLAGIITGTGTGTGTGTAAG
jgi:hypothetical protein